MARWAGGAAATLLVAGVTALALMMATGPGHEVARGLLLDQLQGRLNGSVSVGAIGGELWRYAEARDVAVLDSAGRPAIRVDRLRVGYSVLDLVRGRIVARSLTLTRPVVVLEQQVNGTWNVQHLLRADSAPGVAGARPHVELRQARVVDGTLIVRRRIAPDSVEESRVVGLTFEIARARLAHPESTAITARLTSLAARLISPSLHIVHADGDVLLDGDSISFRMERLRTSGSELAAAGSLHWPEGRLTGEVALRAGRIALSEAHELEPRLPHAGELRGAVRIVLAPAGTSADVENLEIRTGRTSARLRGRLTRSASGALYASGLALDLAPLDFALLEPFLDSLPVRGLVRGSLRVTGAPGDLLVEAAASFTDEAAPGHATSSLTGRGRIGLSSAPEIRDFTVLRATIALVTARRFAPALTQEGRVEFAGRVSSGPGEASFEGRVAHVAPGARVSHLRGSARLVRGDSARVTADFVADSLWLGPLLHGMSRLELRGAVVGRLAASGPLDSVRVDAALSGEWGALDVRGALRLSRDSIVTVLSGSVAALNASALDAGWPDSRVTARWSAALRFPRATGARPGGTVSLTMGPGAVAGLALRGGGALLHFEPERVRIDSARLDVVGGGLTAAGAVASPGTPPRQLSFQLRVDTMATIAPVVRWLARAGAGTEALRLDGAAALTGRLVGTSAAWELLASLELQRAGWSGYGVRRLQVGGLVTRDSSGLFADMSGSADSLGTGALTWRGVQARFVGRPESARAAVVADLGEGVSVRGSASYTVAGGQRTVRLDSAVLDLVVGGWVLAAPAAVRMTGDSFVVDSLELRGTSGMGRAAVSGSVAFRGSGRLAVMADSLALIDVLTLSGRDTTGVGGLLSFAGRLEGDAAAPTMELQLSVRDGRYRDYRAPDLQLFGTYANQRLSIKGGVWSGPNRLVALSGVMPVNLALRHVPQRRLPSDSLLMVASAESLNLALLGPIVTAVRDLQGSARFDVRVTGSWESPQLSGFIAVDSGALRVPALGVRYNDITMRLELRDTTLRVVRGGARAEGTIELAGAVYFPRTRGLGRPQLDLTARAERFHALEMRDFAGGTVSGNLALRGPFIGAELSGRLVANAGYLKFADLVEKRIVSLDDPEFRAIVDSNLARSADLAPDVQTLFLDSLRIRDFQIAMGNDVWLRSSEANIQLAGEFVMNKTIEDGLPRLRMDGTLRTVRGVYRLVLTTISKEFRVTEGTIRFFGTPDFNPEMDITAEHVVRTVEGSQLRVRVLIGGTLLAPRLRLESDQRPPLSETEIVSYLMFGQPATALQAGAAGGFVNRQALVQSLTATLTGYAAGELGSALISDLGLPLDYITIRPGAGTAGTLGLSNARIEAGTQIGSRTFLVLDAGLCEVRTAQVVGASVEYRLNPRWTVTATLEPLVSCGARGIAAGEVNSRYQVGFDLFWSLGIR